jgi:hypothetical protein
MNEFKKKKKKKKKALSSKRLSPLREIDNGFLQNRPRTIRGSKK